MDVDSGKREENKLVFVCVDASEHSIRAFDWFYNHFYRAGHTIGIIHIHTLPVSQHANKLADVDGDYNARKDDILKKSSMVIQCYLDMCTDYGIKAKIFARPKTESIGQTICELVKEYDPSSVVIGQRGLGAVKRTIFGSVSEYILHHAHIPVLIVPPPKERK